MLDQGGARMEACILGNILWPCPVPDTFHSRTHNQLAALEHGHPQDPEDDLARLLVVNPCPPETLFLRLQSRVDRGNVVSELVSPLRVQKDVVGHLLVLVKL